MAIGKKLVYTIKAIDGTTLTIKIPYTRDDLTMDEVKGVMDILIQNKIFPPSGGRLTVDFDIRSLN
jgi:hypothetical protein